jgi:spore coat polysaccharide biosynthesis protein SpsF
MSSERCPGKVLRRVNGKPLLAYLLDTLSNSRAEAVVATSADRSDDPIAEFCQQRGQGFYRGPLEDVTLRLLKASRGHETFLRVCADSPLLRANAINKAISLSPFLFRGFSLVSNVPAGGNSVEAIKRADLAGAYSRMTKEEKEHVTLHLYRNEGYHIKRFKSRPAMLVDTESDWVKFQQEMA